MNLLSGLIPQKQEEAPVVNSNDQTLKDLQKQIDDLKKENEELKKQPATPATPETPETTPVQETPTVEDTGEIQFNSITVGGAEAKDGKNLNIEVMVKNGKKLSDGRIQHQGWQTLADAYGVPNTLEFRNWFRKNHLKGKDGWNAGKTQPFPKEITYPEGSNNTYQFDPDKFANAHDYRIPKQEKGSSNLGDLEAKKGPGTPAQASSTTHGGSFRGTINGQAFNVRSDGQKDQDAVRADLAKQLKAAGATDAQAQAAVKNAKIK
ncbi:MAG: hypothetical protein NC390_06585 [Fusobacterium sp.]|nr:hypothetical protein [Fusobacterium sp.]